MSVYEYMVYSPVQLALGWYCECDCGWEDVLDSEELAEEATDLHSMSHEVTEHSSDYTVLTSSATTANIVIYNNTMASTT